MGRNRRRSADDEWGPRFIDQDGIDLIDDGVIITSLDLLLAGGGHPVVAQIIEPELTVRAVGNVHPVLLPADIRWLIVLNATAGESKKAIQLAHPLSVAASEVIVHRHQM